ncbi:MAG: stage II sporulation protein R [Clostridia bacterium]
MRQGAIENERLEAQVTPDLGPIVYVFTRKKAQRMDRRSHLWQHGFVLGTAIACYAKSAQSELASQFIRFHVLANSDTDEDQALKLKVRDAVLEDMREYLESSTSLQETRESLEQNLSRIRQVALSVLRQEGCGYDVTVSLEPSQFPTKRYGNISLPARLL